MSDWKKKHAEESQKAIDHEFVVEVMEEYAANMGFSMEDGLEPYGLRKVAMYAAQVARAQALGFDPKLLSMSAAEATEAQLRLAEQAVKAGKPVFVIQTEGECPDCGGTGRIRRQKDWRIDPCSFCSGTGKEGER